MGKRKMKSGIQRKYLRYTIGLLLLTILLSSAGVWIYLRENVTKAVKDKYEFMNEKMGISLDTLFRKTDEVTAECIVNEDVQQSLRVKPLEDIEKNSLSKYFAYIDLDHVAEYCYVDNKQNIYTRAYSKINYEDFKNSGFADKLGESYAKTQWFWAEDTLFGTGKKALFIGRNVHCLDYSHESGALFFKMNESFLEEVIGENRDVTEHVAVGIMDKNGNICASWSPDSFEMSEEHHKELMELAAGRGKGVIADNREIRGGVYSAYRQEQSGLIVFTIVPDTVLNQGTDKVFYVMAGIFLVVMIVAAVFSVYFSNRFTRPIQDISEAMTSFDGKDFSRTINLDTHTELDQIGHSYNLMLENIDHLLKERKEQEKELRTSEMNMLISQINPHFLYNTLDTIYMLARISGEETTMKMIQALSKYLRLSLSKGSDMVTVEDELENVKNYMQIQQIRNENLFRYEIDCQVDSKKTWVIKLILQPLVENAIKYGFCEIYEGGLIRIGVKEGESSLIFTVFNNGVPMQKEIAEKINELNEKPLLEAKDCFKDKQHGYGVVNVITRLRLKYGEDVRLTYETEKNGTTCIIRIPGDGKENTDL